MDKVKKENILKYAQYFFMEIKILFFFLTSFAMFQYLPNLNKT